MPEPCSDGRTPTRFDRMRATLDMVRVASTLSAIANWTDPAGLVTTAVGHQGAAELTEAELQTVATGNLGDALRDAGDSDAARQLYETAWGSRARRSCLWTRRRARDDLALALDGSWPDVETYIGEQRPVLAMHRTPSNPPSSAHCWRATAPQSAKRTKPNHTPARPPMC